MTDTEIRGVVRCLRYESAWDPAMLPRQLPDRGDGRRCDGWGIGLVIGGIGRESLVG